MGSGEASGLRLPSPYWLCPGVSHMQTEIRRERPRDQFSKGHRPGLSPAEACSVATQLALSDRQELCCCQPTQRMEWQECVRSLGRGTLRRRPQKRGQPSSSRPQAPVWKARTDSVVQQGTSPPPPTAGVLGDPRAFA